MFTGIIEELGVIRSLRVADGKKYFTINCRKINDDLKIGDSIACNGICLTVTEFNSKSITVEVMNETVSKTTAKDWNKEDKINLERALKFNSRLDGHIVQGHIDTVSHVISVKDIKGTKYIEIELASEYAELVVPQGSIAINGVSLTIAKLATSSLQVALISLTENFTNLSLLKSGQTVNLEFDIIGKYLLRKNSVPAKQTKSKITQAWLNEQGF
jgi:riboflavin synthase